MSPWWNYDCLVTRAIVVLESLRRKKAGGGIVREAAELCRLRLLKSPHTPRFNAKLWVVNRHARRPGSTIVQEAYYLHNTDTFCLCRRCPARNRDMPQETEDETATGLIARMREYPADATLMAMLSDHWQEQGDPRWEPMQILSETPTTPDSVCYLYTETGEAWGNAAIEAWAAAETSCPSLVDDRLMLCRVWKQGMCR